MGEKLKFPDNPEKNNAKELCKNIITSLDVLANLLKTKDET